MENLKIARVTEADIAEVCQLLERTWNDVPVSESLPTFDEWREQTRSFLTSSLTDERIFVAVVHDSITKKVIACGAAIIYDHDPHHYFVHADQIGYIRLMRVDVNYRGQGIGEKMLSTFMTWFKDNGISDIHLHASERAYHLYERAGFHVSQTVSMWYSPESEGATS